MSEAALRLLDRDLPRVDMYNPAFRRRVLDARKEASGEAAKVDRKAEIAARKARRLAARRELIAMDHIIKAENERLRDERDKALKVIEKLTANLSQRAVAEAKHEAQLVREGVRNDPLIPAIDIIKDVATKYGLTVAILRGPSRFGEVVAVRHEAMAAVHMARPDLSLPALGRIFHRDHTSLLHALKKMGARAQSTGDRK